MVSAALNAPELQENLKLSPVSAPLPHRRRPLLSALAEPLLQAEVADHFRMASSLLSLCKLIVKCSMLIIMFGEICQNIYIT